MRFQVIVLFALFCLVFSGMANHLPITSRGCDIGGSNHCVAGAYCPTRDLVVAGQLIAVSYACHAQLPNYNRCNSDEMSNNFDEQCIGVGPVQNGL